MITVHILKHGRSYCGMPGVPGSWPPKHQWISFEDNWEEHATCGDCRIRAGLDTGALKPLTLADIAAGGARLAARPLPTLADQPPTVGTAQTRDEAPQETIARLQEKSRLTDGSEIILDQRDLWTLFNHVHALQDTCARTAASIKEAAAVLETERIALRSATLAALRWLENMSRTTSREALALQLRRALGLIEKWGASIQ